MSSNRLSVHEAKSFDLVAYLDNLGYQPTKVRGNDYWYLSPLRLEKTASFKVNRKLNVWYDHGIGKGGNLVDFGVLFHQCTVAELLQKMEGKSSLGLSFQSPLSALQSLPETSENRIRVTAARPVGSPSLWRYLRQRNIEPELAKKYLKEVSFELNGKSFTTLGFENNSGGFELRNNHFKGSSSPKDITLIDKKSEAISVFEGCFSFLSYLNLGLKAKPENEMYLPEGHTDFLVLNSLSFFEKSRSAMEAHSTIHLYLDRDTAGLKATQQALGWSEKYKDRSSLYSSHKDLNDFLNRNQKTEQRQSPRRGMRL
jgi:DNA primase